MFVSNKIGINIMMLMDPKPGSMHKIISELIFKFSVGSGKHARNADSLSIKLGSGFI